jgi:hypothetical protein
MAQIRLTNNMSIYVLLKKKREHQTSLPFYEIHDSAPEVVGRDKLMTLEPGDCIDVATFSFSDDLSYLKVTEYCISNDNGKAREQLTESYTLPRYP